MRNLWHGNVQDIREEISTSAPPYSSTKNPYFEKIRSFCGTRCFVNEETENNQTRWRECFKNYPPELHVEIGCNGGHYLLEKARLNPKCAFIGIDWKLKQIYKASEKANKQHLTNTLFLKANAERIANIFGQHEIDHLYCFFPDPWPKQSQQKKRFFTKERLTQISNIIKPGGIFEIKTDHEDYYAWILKELQKVKHQWNIIENQKDIYKNHPNPSNLKIPEITLFEKIFIREKKPIHYLKLSCPFHIAKTAG